MKKPLHHFTTSPHHPIRAGCFITGTDTGVGKTLVTAALACSLVEQGYSIGVMKPVETGVPNQGDDHSDAAVLKVSASVSDQLDQISPYRLSPPLAPLAAARLAGVTIELERIARRFASLKARYAMVLVEGIGGVMVPVGADWDVRDLIARLDLPVLVVGRAALGGVNHALLTLDALRQRGLPILALLLNQPAAPSQQTNSTDQIESTVSLLRERSGVPVLGPLPYGGEGPGDRTERIRFLSASPYIGEVARLLTTGA